MACRYYYKGHEFNSEMALDDFLIENKRFEPILGDAVFSQSSAKNNTEALLVPISQKAKELMDKYQEWKRENKIQYIEEEEMYENPPYIGVNKFLSGLKNSKGKLLFPEFIEENYWNERYSKWKEGNFTEDEIDEFSLDKDNLPKISDETQMKQMSEQMKKRWETQAKTGSAIHNILQIAFTKNPNGTYNINLSKEELKRVVVSKLQDKSRQYLTDKDIIDTIDYAKQLYEDIKRELDDDDLSFYPEFCIAQDTNSVTDKKTLFGIIDLLIVDSKGMTHVIDYKTSIHSQFATAKQAAYSYQLAVYQRMLEKCGIDTYGGKLIIAPIQISGFTKKGDTYVHDKIQSFDTLKVISNISLLEKKVYDNINEFLPPVFNLSISAEESRSTVSGWMAKCFPQYASSREVDTKYTINLLKRAKKLEKNDEGFYTFYTGGKDGTLIKEEDEAKFVKKVEEYLKSRPSIRLQQTKDIKYCLKTAIRQKSIRNVTFPKPSDAKLSRESDKQWIQSTLSKYCDGNWEIVDNDVAESYGILVLKTKDIDGVPNQVDFVRVSTNDLTYNYRANKDLFDKSDPIRSRIGLTGTFEPDIDAYSKNNSLMAQAINGNIELMETLAYINQFTGIESDKNVIGRVTVINPIYGDGISMSNEQLLYCFNELNKYAPLKNNKILSGSIRFAKKYELVVQDLNRILSAGEDHEWEDEYRYLKGFKSCVPNYDSVINGNTEDQIIALQKLLQEIESHDVLMRQVSGVYTKQSELARIPIALHNAILIAISQLKGVNFKQQINDHDKWLESIFIHKHGVSGSYLDNPGNLNSDTLNLITRLVQEAYQNTRDDIMREKGKITELVKNLKKEQGFNLVKEYTVGNQAELYKNMYEVTPDGNLRFTNPNNLTGAAREFLIYALDKINSNRFPNKTKEERDKMMKNDVLEYYEVPLAVGGSDSVVSTQGLLSLLRAKLSYLNPQTAFKRAQEKVRGVYDKIFEGEEETQNKTETLFKMQNMFDRGQKENRLDIIKQKGVQYFERNLETLLLKHIFAYSVQENMDQVFPVIKAAMVHITTEGAMRNEVFNNDIDYIEDYINNKIHHKSLVNPKYQKITNVLDYIKQAASKFVLAFSPVQMFYQPLQGLWQDISLIIRKPDGTQAFTFKNFFRAWRIVYSELVKFSDKPTLCQLLNEQYGINDMDMNTYIDRITSGRHGFIWNFERFMFKFASRPDYYNRMAIMLCQMMEDGSLEAHSINSKGELVYNWEKDKRFKAFATNDKSDMEEYNKSRSLYYTVAKQFVREGTKSIDGKKMFELNMTNREPLPRAYTTQQAESIKSLGDDIYGYYTDEKKSLILAQAIGSMWLHFKTYWSGKKNQYLAKGGVKLRGKIKQVTQNGKPYYYQVDENGNILDDEQHPPTTKVTNAPFYQWVGSWQEGIMVTLSDMAKNMVDSKSITKGFKEKWDNADEELRILYRSNIKQMGYDLIMFALIGSLIGSLLGDWLDDLKKKNSKNRDFMTGLYLSAANISVMAVKNSFVDLNFIDSIGSPIGQWTPFAFEWGAKTFANWWNVAMGDEDFWDGVVKTSSTLKQIKPALDSIKPDMFRTEREGGTFGVK